MTPTIVRLSPCLLEIRGLVCGQCHDRGRLLVQDWNSYDRWRYEVYCECCSTCDPNGWSRQDQLIASARDYFNAFDPSTLDTAQGIPYDGHSKKYYGRNRS